MFIVFDLDGTLANLNHRLHLAEEKDWRAFFAAVGSDEPIKHVIQVAQALNCDGHYIEIWSGRSDECRADTEAWLDKYDVPYRALVMRKEGDRRPDDVVKREFLRSRRPDMIFDDRDRVVAMWRAEGIPCFQVAPGPF